jgi:hypothetical protein
MKIGTRVKMSEEFKRKLRLNGCGDHVEEFGKCIGIVEGPAFEFHGPEVDVRWQPSNLRYAYDPENLLSVE